MKRAVIILGIILTSGIAALSLNKKAQPKVSDIKISKTTNFDAKGYDDFKSDIANAD